MSKENKSLVIERAIVLHKIIRLITLTTAGSGYLNFMGNEFGHPEWIDFPREGNNWSYKYARRQWSLAQNMLLKYQWLGNFDKVLIRFASDSNLFSEKFSTQRYVDVQRQVLVYSRKNYLFAFNFNFANSYNDTSVAVEPGKYKVLFTTDDVEFGGHGRVDKTIEHFTLDEVNEFGLQNIKLYLPTRTGMVLQKIV
jgi:1,4-alpha-glucan branching enzyme